jgi:hypothetical protein
MTTDWHAAGCHRSCAHEHTHQRGACAHADHAPAPLPHLSVLRTRTADDGHPEIATQQISFTDLTDLIAAALHDVDIVLGPNSLKLLRDGHRMRLTEGEYWHMALAAATALTTDGDAR